LGAGGFALFGPDEMQTFHGGVSRAVCPRITQKLRIASANPFSYHLSNCWTPRPVHKIRRVMLWEPRWLTSGVERGCLDWPPESFSPLLHTIFDFCPFISHFFAVGSVGRDYLCRIDAWLHATWNMDTPCMSHPRVCCSRFGSICFREGTAAITSSNLNSRMIGWLSP
jgi:hypothetical protein